MTIGGVADPMTEDEIRQARFFDAPINRRWVATVAARDATIAEIGANAERFRSSMYALESTVIERNEEIARLTADRDDWRTMYRTADRYALEKRAVAAEKEVDRLRIQLEMTERPPFTRRRLAVERDQAKARVAQLEAALRKIAAVPEPYEDYPVQLDACVDIARAALEAK